jgi:protein-L-isoaspartate O-methyltransferase
MIDYASSLEALLCHVVDKPVLLARLAHLLLAKGQAERARELCTRAVAMAPESGEIHALAAEVFSRGVPTCYFPLVHDIARNRIYETVFRRAIRPGSRVLDIGAGTGLFAMMAARAGAGEVITCEAIPQVATVVSDVVARNGLAGRVRVIAKRSSDLEFGSDLDGPVDMIVWDNLANNLIGAGALPAIEQAVRRLARPGAPVIPARGRIQVALAEDRTALREQMSNVEGFDLTPFNRLAPAWYQLPRDKERVVLRSEPGDLFTFDFESGGPFPEARGTVTLSASGGRANGVVQWVHLDIDDEESYQFPCAEKTSASGGMFYPLLRPMEMTAGDTLRICGSHDRLSLRIWADVRPIR